VDRLDDLFEQGLESRALAFPSCSLIFRSIPAPRRVDQRVVVDRGIGPLDLSTVEAGFVHTGRLSHTSGLS
jgi:hypothetical protein